MIVSIHSICLAFNWGTSLFCFVPGREVQKKIDPECSLSVSFIPAKVFSQHYLTVHFLDLTMEDNNRDQDDAGLQAALKKIGSIDILTQNEGVQEVIKIGKAAVPSLIRLLQQPETSKAQIMYALAQIGDDQAKQAFTAGIRDNNEQVRAYAAEGLVKIGSPNAMEACLQTLNDAADPLHADRTPSVAALANMGVKAAPFLLDLLLSQDEMTRLHSQRALELILMIRFGFRTGHGFSSQNGGDEFREMWRANGNYNYADDAAKRQFSVTQLRQWFDTLIG